MVNRMDIKSLLELRKRIKKRKPDYKYFGSKNRIKKKGRWRKQRGRTSKIRLKKRGYPRRVEIGYNSPKLVRDMHPSGLFPVLIHNINELKNVDSKTQGIIISSKVGLKKKIEICKKAREMNIVVLNIDIDKLIKKFEKKKEEKEIKAKEKEKKREELEKRAKEKEKKEEKKESVEDIALKEEKKEEMKKEYEKILTKPQK